MDNAAIKMDSTCDPLISVCHTILEEVGEDPSREGLVNTPERFARAYREITAGYGQTVAEVVGTALFESPGSEMVLVNNLEFYSMCEHHLLPFFGKVHVSYVPGAKIIGLSKIPRLVRLFARRFQVQERLTNQIADALSDVLQPEGVGVVVEANHLCMMMRGISVQSGSMRTLAFRGSFETNPDTRDTFLRSIGTRI